MKQYDVVAIGTAYIDINCMAFPFTEDGLLVETETVGGEYETVLGGSGLNFCRLCTRLGLDTAFISKIGKDSTGETLTALMEKAGVEAGLIVDPKASTNVGINVVNTDGQSIALVAGTANKLLTAEEVAEKTRPYLSKAKYLYLSSCFKFRRLLPVFMDLAKTARAEGALVIVDHGRIHSGVTNADIAAVKQLVQLADYYLPSRDEFMKLWKVQTIIEGLLQVANDCPGRIVVKDGTGGALTLIDGKAVRAPAYDVVPINTVGAGDAFNAGLIAGLNKGLSMPEAMAFGCATAALKVSQEKLPSRSELEALLAKGTS